jgi:hypothetical protein
VSVDSGICTISAVGGVCLRKLTFGSMESLVHHVGRHRRFAYQSHRKRTSRLAIPYRRRRFRDDQGTLRFHTLDMLMTSRKTRLSSLTVWIRMTRDCNANFFLPVIEKEPVDWRYHIGDDVFVTIKAPFLFI